jgi:hypothetical protein
MNAFTQTDPLLMTLGRWLSHLARGTSYLQRRGIAAFQLCGCAGLLFAIALTASLVLSQGLSPKILAAIIGTAVSTFIFVALLTKIIVGDERLVYYHHEIAVMGSISLLLWALHQPILPYLDLTLLGVGTFLAFGRIGCLMVGCCHGRPHAWGVCYSAEHALAGFDRHFVGVRLFPVQVIESLSVSVIVAIGSGLILRGSPPGTALVWFVGAYGVVRFSLEFLRGDLRPYRWGFSEAQWVSLVLMTGISLAGSFGLLPWYPLHAASTLGLILAMVGLALRRRLEHGRQYLLFDSNHISEIAALLTTSQVDDDKVWLGTTSQGMKISSSITTRPHETIRHYALSFPDHSLSTTTAQRLAALVCQLEGHQGSCEMIQGKQGVFHLLLHQTRHAPTSSPAREARAHIGPGSAPDLSTVRVYTEAGRAERGRAVNTKHAQSARASCSAANQALPNVHDVLCSPGQRLDGTRRGV